MVRAKMLSTVSVLSQAMSTLSGLCLPMSLAMAGNAKAESRLRADRVRSAPTLTTPAAVRALKPYSTVLLPSVDSSSPNTMIRRVRLMSMVRGGGAGVLCIGLVG